MKLHEWRIKNKSKRNYAHFDNRVSLVDVWDYINNTENVVTHSFYPFIHYVQTFNKYSKDKGIKPKERELCYSAHIDRCIFKFYGYKLNQLYNKRVIKDGTNNSAFVYRDSLRNSNIHFAKQAIDIMIITQ